MPFNGSGVFQRVRNWVADATAGIKIRADYHDAEDDGFATGLTNCITKDGQTVITQNIPFNSKRITGLADPINPQDASTKAYTDTKLDKIGGTITGDLIVTGTITAKGYMGRAGIDGVVDGWWHNLNHVGGSGTLEMWVNNVNLGAIATQAFANTAASNSAAGKVNRSGDTMGGLLNTAGSGVIEQAGAAPSLQVWGTSTASCISFHCPGSFGGNFGMRNDGNFYMGGWSHGGAVYKFWTTRDFTSAPTIGVRLAFAGDWQMPYNNSMIEPFSGSVATGAHGVTNGGPTYVFTRLRMRYLQTTTDGTNWYTVGYA